MCKQCRWLFTLSLLGLGWRVSPAADEPPYSGTLAGDWLGVRSRLLESGVDFRIGYVSELATNVQGGDRQLIRYADQWAFSSNLDLRKLIGLDEAHFQITITDRNGRNLSADAHLGSLQEVEEVYGRGQTWRWTQFWYDQQFLAGRIDWKVGRLTGAEDFASFSCEFQNLTFCGPAPGNIETHYWYNWPVSQWGTRVKIALTGFGYLQLGAYEVNPNALQTRFGLHLDVPGGATGALVPVEVGWLPTFGAGLDGSYKFGLWYSSSPAPDVLVNADRQPLAEDGGTPRMHSGQYGGYVNFQQRLTGASDAGSLRGVRVFLNATFADRRTSTLDSQIALGLFYTGVFKSRPDDDIGLAIGRNHLNSRLGAPQTLQQPMASNSTPPLQGSEFVSELFYGLQALNGVALRPNIQFVHQPGGVPAVSNDVIASLKLSVDF